MEAFDRYVKQFDFDKNGIEYKYYHSYRVQKYSEIIADSLNLKGDKKELATTIGLLHDIGRFYQLDEYKTYDDKKFDHADYGAKLLFEDNLIEEFNLNKDWYEIIRKAVKNHNKYEIEEGLNEEELFYAKLIRDADKIDILNAFSSLRALEVKESNDNISDLVKEDFYSHKTVNIRNIKNSNDKIISYLAFIFDINFEASFKIIKEEDFINKLYEILKNKEIFKEYFDYADKYLDEVLKKC